MLRLQVLGVLDLSQKLRNLKGVTHKKRNEDYL